jgi:hypothetical protein
MPQQPMPPVVCLQNAGTATVPPCQCYVAASVPSRAWHSDICAVRQQVWRSSRRGVVSQLFTAATTASRPWTRPCACCPRCRWPVLLIAFNIRPSVRAAFKCCCSAKAETRWLHTPPCSCVLMHLIPADDQDAGLPPQTLELSHSNLPSVANLGICESLTSLNLSHNRIGSLTGLREVRVHCWQAPRTCTPVPLTFVTLY